MPTHAASERATVTLTPAELADLLGIDREDAGVLATTTVRLPADWVEKWKARLGPLELTTQEVAMLTGRPLATIQDWCAHSREYPLLPSRRVSGRCRAIAPAALVDYLRAFQPTATKPTETPRQQQRRGAAAKKRLADLCSKGPP